MLDEISPIKAIQTDDKTYKSGLPSILPIGLTIPNTIEDELKNTNQIHKLIMRNTPIQKYNHPATITMNYGWPFVSKKPGDYELLEVYKSNVRGKKDISKILCGVYEAHERVRIAFEPKDQ